MMSDNEIADLAAEHKLGRVSDHIFNVWNLPLQPFTTTEVLNFARAMYELGWQEGYNDAMPLEPEGEL